MKKILSMLLVFCLMTVFTTGCSAAPQTQGNASDPVITLQIGNAMMTVDGSQQEIDPGRGTVPVIENDRTLLPVRAVVEAMGGAVAWDEETQTAVLAKGETVILLKIGSNIAFINEVSHTLDTAPVTINDRTMLPIRFVAEGFGYSVGWNGETQTVTLTPGTEVQEDAVMTIQPENTQEPAEETSHSIVVYFSQTGTTRPLALKIAEMTGSDVYEIVPEVPYTNTDIDYGNNSSRANREQNDDSARPAIAGEPIDLSGYDTVYLGYPIWWGTIPRIMQTFMDTYDLSGKTIMPFCTSHSSGIGSSVSAIRQYCPDSDVKDGYRGSGQINESEIGQWLSDNGMQE